MKDIQTKEEWYNCIRKGNVIVLFTADWCPDCQVIKPVLPEIEAAFPSYDFVSVDRDELLEVCQEYDVMGIPSFIAFQQGEEVGRFVSKERKTKEEIITFINDLPA